MLPEIRKIIKEKCAGENWDMHVGLVVKYALILAEKIGADLEITELGALLHDIAWITDMDNDHDHEISGQPMAEKLMKEHGYTQDKIDKVKYIIATHRGSKGAEPQAIEAKIVANADAMAHFDVLPWLIKNALENYNNDLQKSVQWVYNKAERDWNKKITLPEAKDLVREKYEAFKVVLEPMIGRG